MERKVCVDCGQPNLNSETSCWACGGDRFAPAGARVQPGSRTIALGSGREFTAAWRMDRRAAGSFYAFGVAVLTVAFTGTLGYWIGRAGSAREVAGAAAAAGPVTLPSPPAEMAVPEPPAPAPGGVNAEAPVMSVHPRPEAGPPAPGPRQGQGNSARRRPAAALPSMPLVSPRAVAPFRPRPVTIARSTTDGIESPNPALAPPPVTEPTDNTAVVSFRNDGPAPVSILVDGNGSRTAVVSPGCTVPLPLPPGSYQLRATSGGASSATSTMAIAADRSYSLVVIRRREGGKDVLSLIEPAIDSGG